MPAMLVAKNSTKFACICKKKLNPLVKHVLYDYITSQSTILIDFQSKNGSTHFDFRSNSMTCFNNRTIQPLNNIDQ